METGYQGKNKKGELFSLVQTSTHVGADVQPQYLFFGIILPQLRFLQFKNNGDLNKQFVIPITTMSLLQ